MDELKHWREERAARRLDRRLSPATGTPGSSIDRGAAQLNLLLPAASAAAPAPRRLSFRRSAAAAAFPVEPPSGPAPERMVRRRELMARAATHRTRGPAAPLHFWPEPERISPVHPVWDIPRNRRLRAGVMASLAFHVVAIPLFLLTTKIDFNIFGKPEPEDRIVNFTLKNLMPLPPVKGQQGEGLKPIQNEPPPKPPVKPPDNKVHPKPAPPKPTPSKPSNSKPEPTIDLARNRPEPVPDRPTKPSTKPAPEPTKSTTPAINNDVVEGPLLAGKGPVPGSEASIGGVNGVDFPYNYYLELLRTKIAQAWKVPAGSVPPGKRAMALVTFRIQRNGSVSRSTLEEPSGRGDYDQAALRAIIDAQPFPPLPPAFGGQYLVVNFQFAYQGQ